MEITTKYNIFKGRINWLKAVPLFLSIIFFISSCQKAPINGDLDGMWQIMEVDPEPDEILIPERLYYNFYLHVVQLTYYGGAFTTGNLIYDKEKGIIQIEFPNAPALDSILKLRQYGVYTNPVIFQVEYLDKNKLILKNDEATVTLRKF